MREVIGAALRRLLDEHVEEAQAGQSDLTEMLDVGKRVEDARGLLFVDEVRMPEAAVWAVWLSGG
jgi:hypothetical protein